VTKQVADEFMFRSRISHQFTHHLRCAGAVLHRNAHGQITRVIGPVIHPLAQNPEPTAHRRIFSRKTRSGADIREIERQIADRIRFIFQRRYDGEPFASMEK
jgi:hypothetical protein